MDEFDWAMLELQQAEAIRTHNWQEWADLALEALEFDRRLSYEE